MDEENRPRAGSVAALIAAIIAGGIWAIVSTVGDGSITQAARRGDLASALGGALGHAIVIAAILFGVIYLIFLRGRATGRGWMYFLILAAGVATIDLGVVLWAKHAGQSREAGFAVESREISRVKQALQDPGMPPIDMHIYGTGDAAVFERDFKDYAVKAQAAERAYGEALTANDKGHLLGIANLSKADAVPRSQASLAAMRSALAQFRAQLASLGQAVRARIAAEKVDAREKADFLRGFDRSIARDKPMSDRLFDAQDKTFQDMQAAFGVLARRHWSVTAGKVMFSRAADRDAYNAAILTVRADEQARMALAASSRQAMQAP
jgi:hypothetical protein